MTAAGSGAPTGGREGASAQGTNQVYCCEWLTLPLASIVMVVTVFVYVTLQPGGAYTGNVNPQLTNVRRELSGMAEQKLT